MVDKQGKPEELIMDTSLTASIMHAASSMQQQQTAQAVQVSVLKKAMDIQSNAAMQLLDTLPQAAPALANSGSLGTQVNTYA